MDEERIFVIGDIHGCLDEFKRLVNKIDWNPEKDRIILLGDYIDRGPDSKGVVDYVLEIMELSPRIQCLMGNHEALFLDYLSGDDRGLFLYNGGRDVH